MMRLNPDFLLFVNKNLNLHQFEDRNSAILVRKAIFEQNISHFLYVEALLAKREITSQGHDLLIG